MFPPRGQFGVAPPAREAIEEEDEEETLTERLFGLTEMFPEFLRNSTHSAYKGAWWLGSNGTWFVRNSLWVVSTSLLIGFLPLAFEKERLDMEQESLKRQQQMLLGPGVAQQGPKGVGMGSVMGMMPK